MKRLLVLGLLFVLAETSFGSEAESEAEALGASVQYLHTNLSLKAPIDFAFSWHGTNLVLEWYTTNAPAPTIAQLRSVKAVAVAWKANHDKDVASDVATYDDRTRAVIKALIKVINLRLPADKKITTEELKAAIKEEL